MRYSSFEKAIIFLAQKLKPYQYAFRGTSSLVIHGLNIEVEDIDILCDKETALKCNKIFKKFILEEVSYKESLQFKSYFGKFKVKNKLVEVMGEWQIRNPKGVWTKVFCACPEEKLEIFLGSQKIPVTTIDFELATNMHMGRSERCDKIKKKWFK